MGNEYEEDDILLDTGSTVSVFKNSKILTDIRKTGQTLRALTNGGHQDSNMKEILPGFFPVWFNEKSRLNILAWRDVRERFRIAADTDQANEITVHMDDNKKMRFMEVDSGLYLYRIKSNDNTKQKVSNYSFLTLVTVNKSLYILVDS